jgi:hypothetical protein
MKKVMSLLGANPIQPKKSDYKTPHSWETEKDSDMDTEVANYWVFSIIGGLSLSGLWLISILIK